MEKPIYRPCEITDGKGFKLRKMDPADTGKIKSKEAAEEKLRRGVQALEHYQEKLYAQDRWALLLIFQAMDAAGKDGTIKHVMSGVNPQGCQVCSFKSPSAEELDHDFLWRCNCALPERGRIGIFNRSYYEETLVVRVHPEILAREKLPQVSKHLWKERFEDINAYERYLSRNGVVIRKFFLNVSKEEQKRRFLSRLEEESKNWKFSMADAAERERWDDYMDAYEETIRHTASPEAPWYVIPADNKWFTRMIVADVIVDTLRSLNLAFPKVDKAKLGEFAAIRQKLERQK